MRGKRIMILTAGAFAAGVLALTGCGGGSSSDNTALVDQLMNDIDDGSMDATVKSCIRDSLSGYSTEDLELLANGETDADIPADLQEKVVTMMMTCLGDTD